MASLFLVLSSCFAGLASAANLGQWGPTIQFPLVPVAASVNPISGKLLVWAAFSDDTFAIAKSGMTQTAEYDPATGTVTAATISDTQHE